MKYSTIGYILGQVLKFEGIFMLLPFLTGMIYHENEAYSFRIIGIICFVLGCLITLKKVKHPQIFNREGFVAVALSWIVLSIFGAIPFVITGEIPSYVDALFETISGFTTTGASILSNVETMTRAQGSYVKSEITYPSGLVEYSADDLHSATYMSESQDASAVHSDRFTDDYTNVDTIKSGKSKIGYSFVIGIIAVILSYLIAVPLGILMARKKDKLVDQLGTIYIVFIIAVPSLAYIFLFKAIGGKMGLPTTFDMDSKSKLMYILPIVSLALPQVANLMKWLRRYMIDQMNSDYVKFARSGGLTEGEIFTKHILKNAAIPIVQGVPASVLFALTGAIITERVYVVPGAGNLLTEAISKYDNGVIVGVTLFYAVLSVISIILGDVLMSMVDPRISFSTKDR